MKNKCIVTFKTKALAEQLYEIADYLFDRKYRLNDERITDELITKIDRIAERYNKEKN